MKMYASMMLYTIDCQNIVWTVWDSGVGLNPSIKMPRLVKHTPPPQDARKKYLGWVYRQDDERDT